MNQALAVNIGTDSESGTICSLEHRNRLYVRHWLLSQQQIVCQVLAIYIRTDCGSGTTIFIVADCMSGTSY